MINRIKNTENSAESFVRSAGPVSRFSAKYTFSLLTAVSSAVLSVGLADAAQAQVLPVECTPRMPMTGDTIVCVASVPDGTIGPISSTVDDLTIVIGDENTPTNVNNPAGSGISADPTSGDITIDSSLGSVSGSLYGIGVTNNGTGAISVTSADVMGGSSSGILASGAGTNLSVDSSLGTVTGRNGIAAVNLGSGSTSVTSADVTGNNGFGIYVRSVGMDLTLDSSAGSVSGAIDGVFVRHYGIGPVSITTADVSGGARSGIDLTAYGDVMIDTTAGTVTGPTFGILARTNGDLTISTADVAGPGNAAIIASVFSNATMPSGDLSVTSTGTLSGFRGIRVSQYSPGTTSVEVTNVTTSGSNAIEASISGSGDSSITATGTVSGTNGVSATNGGGGRLTITVADTVGSLGYGIVAGTVGDLTINSVAGDVSGGRTGIYAVSSSSGTGSISITSADVSGTSAEGIRTQMRAGGVGDLTIDTSAGSVSGGTDGISAIQYGSGALSITSSDVTGEAGNGVSAQSGANSMGDLSVDTSAGTAMGANDGISAQNMGSGMTIINAGTATGTNRFGISVVNNAPASGITITATGDVMGGAIGVQSYNYGNGANSVSVANVTGTAGEGLFAYNGTGGSDLSVTSSGTISGGNFGVRAGNLGSGTTSVSVVGASGAITDGIFAYNSAASADVSVTASGSVTGEIDGIDAGNNGSGALTIITDAVTGNTDAGIRTFNQSTGSSISITANGDVMGNNDGINALNRGTDATTIMAENVTGTTLDGISVRNDGGMSTDINVAATGAIIGGQSGIDAVNNGTGGITISAVDTTGVTAPGIDAQNNNGAGGIDVTSTGTSEGAHGIFAINNTGGDVSVNANNTTGLGFTSGIFARQNSTSADDDLTINSTGLAQGGAYGISAFSNFSSANGTGGGVTINAVDTNGTGADGIIALSRGGAINITSTGTANGDRIGIQGIATGTGGLTITAADVNATNSIGVSASTAAIGTGDLTIDTSAGTVMGGNRGISAFNSGAGNLSITSADVTGAAGAGILASNRDTSMGDVSVNSAAGSVVGGSSGLFVRNYGMGSVSITTADVTGTNNDGILATAAGGDLTIDSTAGSVMGQINGIAANDSGSGDITITSAGVIGTNGFGVNASTNGGSVSIDAMGDISGGVAGILAITQNGATINVGSGHTVTGGSFGIATLNQFGIVTANDMLNIMGTVTGQISTFEGDDSITLGSGAVTGEINLGDGMDSVSLDGGSFAMLRGGDGVDSVNFNAAGAMVNNSGGMMDAIAEFEIFNFNADGAILAGTNSGLTATNFNVGTTTLMGALESTNVTIASGAVLQAADGSAITGNLVNNGSLAINMGGTGTLAIDGALTQAGSGDLTIDIFSTTNSDLITATGDVTLGGTLNINQTDFVAGTITLVDGDTDISGSFATVNGLQNGLFASQSVVTDAASANVNLVTSAANAAVIGALTPNQAAVANALARDIGSGIATGNLRQFALSLGLLPDTADLPAIFDELTPEIVNAGIDGLRSRQDHFRQLLLGQYQPSDEVQNVALSTVGLIGALASGQSTARPSGPQIWGAVSYNYHRNDTTINNIGYRADGFDLTAGISNIAAGAFRLGIAVGYTEFDSRGLRGARDTADSELFRIGVHGSIDLSSENGLSGHVDAAIDYGNGENNITMITAGGLPALGFTQNGSTNTDTIGISMRVTLDGSGGNRWPVQPFISVGYDNFSQDGTTLVGQGVTDLVIDDVDLDRYTVGYGLRADQQWDRTAMRLGLSGYHYAGDTRSVLTSRFFGAGAGGATFNTFGFNIQDQFQIDAGLSQKVGDGWELSLDGYAEFGDLESYGGMFKISKKF